MRRWFLPVLLLIFSIVLTALAQQPATQPATPPAATPTPTPPPSPTPAPAAQSSDDDVVRITTNLVQVDAVVTDKSGKVVTDLKPDEVQILEDGRAQKITHFSYFVAADAAPPPPKKSTPVDKNAPPAPPAVTTIRPDQIRRTIALVVDDLGLSFESTHFVRQALRKFVDEQMQPGDLVAIIRTSGGIGALQQFTADKRRLYAAIEHLRWYANGRAGISPFAPFVPPSPGDQGAAMDAASADLDEFRSDLFSVGTLGAINYVVKGLRELPGRKSILLISDGFKIFNRDDPSRNDRVRQALARLIEQANRASVVIYTMNATGLQTLGLTAADSSNGDGSTQLDQMTTRRNEAFDSQEGLEYLARQTGGIAIRNSNDLSGGVRRVMEDQRGYYLIGYRPSESTFDPRTGRRQFHKLTLKITRPGKFNVRMRNGFMGVSEEETRPVASTPRDQLIGALLSPFGAAGVHMRLTSLFANDPKLGSYMRSLLHINASDLTFTDEPDGSHKAVFDVLAVTFGDSGNIVDQIGRGYTLTLKGDTYKRVLRDGFVYFLTVPVKKPGAYQLRAALRDHGSERVGSASQFIEIPDIKQDRLALSGVILTGVDPAALKPRENGATPGANEVVGENNDREADTNPTNTAAIRQLRSGQLLQYGVVIYNARLDKTTNKPQLQIQVRMFQGGQPMFTGKQQEFVLNNPPDVKRLNAIGGIQLGTGMAPGEYVFQIVVTNLLADQKHRVATQWIDFEIVR